MRKEANTRESFTFFKGKLYKCLSFKLIWWISIPAVTALILFHRQLDIFGILEICVFALYLVIWIISCLNFFGVSDQCLIVKNHCVPGYKKRFFFSDIKEVQLDDGDDWSSIALIIVLITPNEQYHEKYYYGLSLTNEKWVALEKELQRRGVEVHNYISTLD